MTNHDHLKYHHSRKRKYLIPTVLVNIWKFLHFNEGWSYQKLSDNFLVDGERVGSEQIANYVNGRIYPFDIDSDKHKDYMLNCLSRS